jgi:membrane associated rhomboid family serine protease/Zn-finger nucleic acid-binding protein
MEEISVDAEGQTRAIDVCSSCQFVWLDEGEWADLAFFAVEKAPREVTPEAMREAVRQRIAQKRMERNSPPPKERVITASEWNVQPPQLERPKRVSPPEIVVPPLVVPPPIGDERIRRLKPVEKSSLRSERRDSGEVKRRAAQRRLDESKRQKRLVESRRARPTEPKRKSGWGEGPSAAWQWLPAFFGMPVEDEQPLGPRQELEKPWFTWVLAGGVVLIGLLAMLDLLTVVDAYGLIPAEFGRLGGLTWITAFFLHAGLLHLVGNVYFLVIFGDNVEKCLGTLEFFLLLCLATVSGHFVHILLNPDSTVPCIGASGGISGVMAFYALRFRQNQLAVMFWFIVKT